VGLSVVQCFEKGWLRKNTITICSVLMKQNNQVSFVAKYVCQVLRELCIYDLPYLEAWGYEVTYANVFIL
jgi:hypothetical protein